MKTIVGKVVSTKMKDTVVVSTTSVRRHPIYKKQIKKTTRILAHTNEENRVGDVVKLVQTKPNSKNKHYEVEEILEKTKETGSNNK